MSGYPLALLKKQLAATCRQTIIRQVADRAGAAEL
jgi:hypothetical protein